MIFRTIKKHNGFTLAETVISTGLMGIIIVSVLLLIFWNIIMIQTLLFSNFSEMNWLCP